MALHRADERLGPLTARERLTSAHRRPVIGDGMAAIGAAAAQLNAQSGEKVSGLELVNAIGKMYAEANALAEPSLERSGARLGQPS